MEQVKGDGAHSLPLLSNVNKGAGASSLLVLARCDLYSCINSSHSHKLTELNQQYDW